MKVTTTMNYYRFLKSKLENDFARFEDYVTGKKKDKGYT